MINRELRSAAVITFDDYIDEYGQPNKGAATERSIELTLRLYQHKQVEDIRFTDVTHIALTQDRAITDADHIRVDDKEYSIEFVNGEGRLVQLFLKEA